MLNQLSGSNIIPFKLDITNKESIQNFLNKIKNDSIYALINCAGGGGGPYFSNILEEDQEYFDNAFKLNASSTFNLIKYIYPKMINEENPIIINITSIAAHQIFQSSSSYTIAKHSQSVLSQILRRDLSDFGIRLTEIVPGTVNSHNNPSQNISIAPQDISDLIKYLLSTKGNVNINRVYISHLKEVPFLS